MELKLTPPLKIVAALPWSTVQLYSTVNSVQNDEKRLITLNVHKE